MFVKSRTNSCFIDMSFHVYTQALHSEAHLMWSLTGISYYDSMNKLFSVCVRITLHIYLLTSTTNYRSLSFTN